MRLSATVLSAPLSGFALQSPKARPHHRFLDPGTRESGLYGPFFAGVKELGYLERTNSVINGKTAAALGIKVSQSMRITAEKVIE